MPAIRKAAPSSERSADVRHLFLMVAGRDHAIFRWDWGKIRDLPCHPGADLAFDHFRSIFIRLQM
jgi:hypothetical protein